MEALGLNFVDWTIIVVITASVVLSIIRGFVKEFMMTNEDYDKEVLKTSGTVTDFYYAMEDKYGKRGYLLS